MNRLPDGDDGTAYFAVVVRDVPGLPPSPATLTVWEDGDEAQISAVATVYQCGNPDPGTVIEDDLVGMDIFESDIYEEVQRWANALLDAAVD